MTTTTPTTPTAVTTTPTTRRPRRIVVGVDGSLGSHAAVRWAIDNARAGDTVQLVHAWEPAPISITTGPDTPNDDTPARNLIQREVARANCLVKDDQVVVTGEAIRGAAGDCLADIDADLIVVGSRGHGTLIRALTGSVCTHLTNHASVPVVVIPDRRRGRQRASAFVVPPR